MELLLTIDELLFNNDYFLIIILIVIKIIHILTYKLFIFYLNNLQFQIYTYFLFHPWEKL